jgi:hypothetical protein
MRKRLLLLTLSLAAGANAQAPTTCATKCNTQASECMKACIGDPKDAQQPDRAKHLMTCMKSCEEANRVCKAGCGGAEAPRPRERN